MRKQDLPRRKLLQVIAGTTLSAAFPIISSRKLNVEYPDQTGMSRIPKIALELSRTGPYFATGTIDKAGMRRVQQLGVSDVIMGGPPIPWREPDLRALMEKLKSGGLTLGNMMISGFPKTVYGKPGRDEEVEQVRQSIRRREKWDCLSSNTTFMPTALSRVTTISSVFPQELGLYQPIEWRYVDWLSRHDAI